MHASSSNTRVLNHSITPMCQAPLRLPLPSPAYTKSVAAAIATQCLPGDMLLLYGEIGSGKTTFAQGFIQHFFEAPEAVTSPTFTLMQSYEPKDSAPIWHLDLYRLEAEEEIEELGLQELSLQSIMLIEWPALAESFFVPDRLEIHLQQEEGAHTMQLTPHGRFLKQQQKLQESIADV